MSRETSPIIVLGKKRCRWLNLGHSCMCSPMYYGKMLTTFTRPQCWAVVPVRIKLIGQRCFMEIPVQTSVEPWTLKFFSWSPTRLTHQPSLSPYDQSRPWQCNFWRLNLSIYHRIITPPSICSSSSRSKCFDTRDISCRRPKTPPKCFFYCCTRSLRESYEIMVLLEHNRNSRTN